MSELATAKKIGTAYRRILIADDNKSRFNELVTTLKQADFDVLHVDNRTKLVEEALKFQADIVLVNLFLNGTSTINLIKEMKQKLDL